MFRPLNVLVATICLPVVLSSTAQAVELNDAEQAFVDQLTNVALVGRFSIAGRDTPPKPERYEISKVQKLGGSKWLVTARIKYGQHDLEVPVAVDVHWAGDTPVLSVTDIKIPGLGEGFTTRVLFYKDRYAGSWYHGEAGGHMWGMIEAGDDEDEVSLENLSEEDRRVVEKLDERTRVWFLGIPLEDAISSLSKDCDLRITFSADVPEQFMKAPVDLTSDRFHRVGHLLPRILQRLGLSPFIVDGGIEIRPWGSEGMLAISKQKESSVEKSLQQWTTLDLSQPLGKVAQTIGKQENVDVEIQPGINPELWITFQAENVQLRDALESMLADLGLEAVEDLGRLLIRAEGGVLTMAHEQMGVVTTAEFRKTPLHDAADYFSKLHDVTITLGPNVDRDVRVTFLSEGFVLHSVLTGMLSPHDLKPVVKEGAIVIQVAEAK